MSIEAVMSYGTCPSCEESHCYLHEGQCYGCLGFEFAEPDPPSSDLDSMLLVEPPASANWEVKSHLSDGSAILHYFTKSNQLDRFIALREQLDHVDKVELNPLGEEVN